MQSLHAGAARAMGTVAEHWTKEDVEALAKNVSPEVVEAFEAASPVLNPELARASIETLSKNLAPYSNPELEAKATARRPITPDDYRARSVLFVSEEARLSYLVRLPEEEIIDVMLVGGEV